MEGVPSWASPSKMTRTTRHAPTKTIDTYMARKTIGQKGQRTSLEAISIRAKFREPEWLATATDNKNTAEDEMAHKG